MAVTAINNPSGLKLKYDCGKDDNGKAIRRTKTYSNLRHNALHDDIYTVATMIASLQDNILMDVSKVDNTTIAQ